MEEKIKQETKKENVKIEILDFLRITLICFIFVFLCVKFIFRPVTVDGLSMYPTLKDQEFGFSNIFSTFVGDPKRFDVVVAEYEPTGKLWVKRVIGLPGETVQFLNDKLYINGKYVEEKFLDKDYIAEQTNNGATQFTDDFGPFKLGNDQYLLCGDNRKISYDSRKVGPFRKKDIVSKYVYVVYPFDQMGIVDNE